MKQGSTLIVFGYGFKASTSVTVSVNGTHLAIIKTDGSGNFSSKVTLPAWVIGVVNLQATGLNGRGGELTVTARLTVTTSVFGKVPPKIIVRVLPSKLFFKSTVLFRMHLYDGRGTVSGTVSVGLSGETLCASRLVRGVGTCTASASKIGPGRHLLLVAYGGSASYLKYNMLVSVYIH